MRKMIKIIVTRCYILLKCTIFDLCWGSAPDPARGAHSAPQTLSWIQRVLLFREEKKRKKKRKRKEQEGEME